MGNKLHRAECAVSNVKVNSETGEFTCYGNVKGVVDHALDMTMNGAFADSVKSHKAAGSMPGMFWMHKSSELPVGVWTDMVEDSRGLKMTGRLSKTTLGRDIEILAKDGALNKFSIGYYVDDEKWNAGGGFNELRKVDITEVSWVTRACNEESVLLDIKSRMDEGKMPTKRELEKMLKESGFSSRQAKKVADCYKPAEESDDLFNELKSLLGETETKPSDPFEELKALVGDVEPEDTDPFAQLKALVE
ncbi:head maturation protease [Vibrio phage D164]